MTEPNVNFESGEPQENESWKNQVASRLDTYRTRNKRKLSGEFSMRFNFEGEAAGPRQQICVPQSVNPEPDIQQLAEVIESHSEAVPEEQKNTLPSLEELSAIPAPPVAVRPSIPFKRKIVMEPNVIEFPRLFPPEPPPFGEVAEPVVPSSPRILDAPEIAGPFLETPILDGMRLEHLETAPAPELELPLQVASVRRRMVSGFADCLLVLTGSAVFAFIAHKFMADVEFGKPILGVSVLIPVLFWMAYQYVFLLYGARTPGMVFARLSLSTFQGTAPNRRERILRLLGIAVSCSSLMLGFIWAFFDDDTLCWHDRISRTYTFRQ